MRNEVLRMERVTYKEDEVVKLKDFNLQIFQGRLHLLRWGKGKYLERTL